MPADFGIVYPLWNHAQQGESLLERVHGEVGLDHVTVPVVTGARTQFAFSGDRPTPYFHTEGGWHFPISAPRYAMCGLRPRTAKWCGQRDEVARLRDLALRLGLRLVVRMNPLHAPRVADHAQDALCRDAWGDVYEGAAPCLSHPASRELIEATLADVARYQPDAVELVGTCLDSHPFDLDLMLATMHMEPALELCFCSACRQVSSTAADPDAAARSVRAHVERSIVSGRPREDDDDLREAMRRDPVIEAYRDARVASAEQWLSQIRRKQPCGGGMLERTCHSRGHVGWNGVDGWAMLDSLVLSCDRDVAECEADAASASPEAVCLSLGFCRHAGADSLVRAVYQARRGGTRFFDFEDLEGMPPAAIGWLKQAVRYARRDADSEPSGR